MPAVESTLGILDKDNVARLVRALDESGTGAGPWRHVAHESFGDLREIYWNYAAAAGGIVNTVTAVTIKTAAPAGLRNYITSMQIAAEALGTATELVIRDGAGGPVLWRVKISTGGLALVAIEFPKPLKGSVATLLEAVTLTASGTGAVYVNAQGYFAP